MSFDWYARIVSDEYDKLKSVAGKLTSTYFSVIQIGDEVFIKSNKFNGIDSPSNIISITEDMIKLFHGLLLVNVSLPKINVRVNGVLERNSNHYYIFASDHLNLRGQNTITNKIKSTLNPDNDPNKWIELVMLDNNVKVAIEYSRLGLNEPFVMYDVYEIIYKDVNKKLQLISSKYTEKYVGSFTGTLNDPRELGERARHAIPKGNDPMKNPMTLDECQGFITELLHDWIHYKLNLYNLK